MTGRISPVRTGCGAAPPGIPRTLECVRGRGRVVVGQEVEVPGTHMGELAHVDVVLTTAEEQSASGREAYYGFSHSQVCGHIHT